MPQEGFITTFINGSRKKLLQRRRKRKAPAVFISSVRNGTNPAALITSSADAPAVRATPAKPAFMFPLKMTLCACSAENAFKTLWIP